MSISYDLPAIMKRNRYIYILNGYFYRKGINIGYWYISQNSEFVWILVPPEIPISFLTKGYSPPPLRILLAIMTAGIPAKWTRNTRGQWNHWRGA